MFSDFCILDTNFSQNFRIRTLLKNSKFFLININPYYYFFQNINQLFKTNFELYFLDYFNLGFMDFLYLHTKYSIIFDIFMLILMSGHTVTCLGLLQGYM